MLSIKGRYCTYNKMLDLISMEELKKIHRGRRLLNPSTWSQHNRWTYRVCCQKFVKSGTGIIRYLGLLGHTYLTISDEGASIFRVPTLLLTEDLVCYGLGRIKKGKHQPYCSQVELLYWTFGERDFLSTNFNCPFRKNNRNLCNSFRR